MSKLYRYAPESSSGVDKEGWRVWVDLQSIQNNRIWFERYQIHFAWDEEIQMMAAYLNLKVLSQRFKVACRKMKKDCQIWKSQITESLRADLQYLNQFSLVCFHNWLNKLWKRMCLKWTKEKIGLQILNCSNWKLQALQTHRFRNFITPFALEKIN